MEIPMKRTIAHILSVIGLVSITALPFFAEDYQCRRAAGCSASISADGELLEVRFRKGDLVSTDDGWIVNPDNGWVKIRTKPVDGQSSF